MKEAKQKTSTHWKTLYERQRAWLQAVIDEGVRLEERAQAIFARPVPPQIAEIEALRKEFKAYSRKLNSVRRELAADNIVGCAVPFSAGLALMFVLMSVGLAH